MTQDILWELMNKNPTSLVIAFATTFLGQSPTLLQELSLPEITGPPIEEEILDLTIVPNVLNLGNSPCLVAYPMGISNL
ncbi:hypothetical protein DSO57_1005465 [Entomophthora muscae]|uniref:Uncharacterized protein n=1 Tax=Entomophthora muscae TaxID=34485 RepID=A0ACC2T7Y6_9FUNG|nr:hypothetical protein DSO57_1005465 [Entomophthora muscae]